MTPTTITISTEDAGVIERLRYGVESRELLDLFGLKFAGVKFEAHVKAGAVQASMIAREVSVVQPDPTPPWSGDGLPPVGTFVRITDDGSLHYGSSESGEVIAHVEDCAVVRMSYGLGCFTARYLEAIKTHAQIAAEEREAAAKAMRAIVTRTHPAECPYLTLYDAGYRLTKGDEK